MELLNGREVGRLRRARKIRKPDFANKIGLRPEEYQKIEGRLSVQPHYIIVNIARVLSIDPAAITIKVKIAHSLSTGPAINSPHRRRRMPSTPDVSKLTELALTDEEAELLRIYNQASARDRMDLLALAYDIEDRSK